MALVLGTKRTVSGGGGDQSPCFIVMRRNIEIKLRLDDVESVQARVERIADSGPELLQQCDTFFMSSRGRLKLREFPDSPGELIYYERPDTREPSESRYLLYPAPDSDTLRRLLAASLGVRGVVRKRRRLYFVGQTRIHLDCVEGLGDYLELEVVLEGSQSRQEGIEIARSLLARLRVTDDALVESAYIDLLESSMSDGFGSHPNSEETC